MSTVAEEPLCSCAVPVYVYLMSTLNKDPRIVDLVVDPINKIQKYKNHTVGTFQKSNLKSIEEENSILLTQIHDHPLFWFGPDTSVQKCQG